MLAQDVANNRAAEIEPISQSSGHRFLVYMAISLGKALPSALLCDVLFVFMPSPLVSKECPDVAAGYYL